MKVYPHELIGRTIKILDSKNKSNLSLQGKIVDETKYTIKVLHQDKIKTLFKRNITFQLGDQIIIGKNLTRRPEERIKGK